MTELHLVGENILMQRRWTGCMAEEKKKFMLKIFIFHQTKNRVQVQSNILSTQDLNNWFYSQRRRFGENLKNWKVVNVPFRLQYTDVNLFDSLGAWIRIVLNCIIYAAQISQTWLLSMQPQISKLTIRFVFWTTHKFHFIRRQVRTIYQKSLWNTENGLKTSFWTWSRLHVSLISSHA